MKPSIRILVCTALIVLTVGSSLLPAQSAAAASSISGSVLDPQGLPVPDAEITIRNTDSGLTRTTHTDPDGRFNASFLPAGTYTLQVRVSGLQLKKPPRLNLGAASSARMDLRLTVMPASESVSVSGTAPMLEGNTLPPTMNEQEPTMRSVIAGLSVTYLPSRDRDVMQLAQLAAATVPDSTGQGVIVSGQRPENVRTIIDGGEFNDPLHGGQRSAGDTALFFPQTSVREFQVVYSGTTAEVGGSSAAFINIATRSGGNKKRGEAFYIGRPDLLSSRDTFGHSLDNAQNEFGGSVGGPIKKDRAFFYAAVEQDFLNQPYWTEFAPQAPGTAIPSQLVALQTETVGKSRPTALFGRLDFTLSSRNTLTIEEDYNRVSTSAFNPAGSTRVLSSPEHQADLTGHSNWVRTNLTSVLRPTLVNQVLAQWGRDHRDFRPLSSAPEIVINGFGVLGGNDLDTHRFTSNDLELSDDLSLSRGAGTINVGGMFAYDPASEFQEPFLNGRFDFSSLQDFVDGRIRRFRQTFVVSDATYRGSIRRLGFYANARRKLGANLTLTAGLRWDGQWNPALPRTAVPASATTANDLNQWQPRLGLAWSPTSGSVVRVSAGLYDATTPASIFQRAIANDAVRTRVLDSYFDPQLLTVVSTLRPLNVVPAGLNTISAQVFGIDPNLRNPRSAQVSVSLEQQVHKTTSVNLGYLHSASWALQSLGDRNLFPPVFDTSGLPIFPAVRPDPTLGQVFFAGSDAHSTYDALVLSANAQLPHRSTVMANYTLSRSRDDAPQTFPYRRVAPLDPFNLSLDRAFSDFDARHTLNLSAVFNLPLGFKVNPIVIARSAMPYTPLVGFDLQNDANDLNERALLGGSVAPRNILRQPAFFNLDLRLVKDITLRGEGHHLDLFMDVFNLTGASNRNFGPDAVNVFGTTTSPLFSAGQPTFAPDTTRYGSARQVQFTVRLVAF